MKSPIFVAIDTPSIFVAEAMATELSEAIGGIKLGLEFFSTNGPHGVERLGRCHLPIFLDLKLHDIPNTVAHAAKALAVLQPAIMTVHASGGLDMMKAARDALPPQTKVVGVTALTSLTAADLRTDIEEYVAHYTALAREAGLDGVVCSGQEARTVRDFWADALIVCPGIRSASAEDQKRTMTAPEAIRAGASILVVGRPITRAPSPIDAARAFMDEIRSALTPTMP